MVIKVERIDVQTFMSKYLVNLSKNEDDNMFKMIDTRGITNGGHIVHAIHVPRQVFLHNVQDACEKIGRLKRYTIFYCVDGRSDSNVCANLYSSAMRDEIGTIYVLTGGFQAVLSFWNDETNAKYNHIVQDFSSDVWDFDYCCG